MAELLWGNISSGLLFCPGTRFYGLTKNGDFFDKSKVGAKVTPTSRTRVWRPSPRYGGCIK